MASFTSKKNGNGTTSYYMIHENKWTKLYVTQKNESLVTAKETASQLFGIKVKEINDTRLGIKAVKRLTLDEFVEKFLAFSKSKSDYATRLHAIKSLRKHGITDIEHFDKFNMSLYMEKCFADGMNVGGVERYFGVFGRMGNLMVEWGHADKSPVRGLLSLLADKKKDEGPLKEEDGRWLSDEEIEAYFNVCVPGRGEGIGFNWRAYEIFGRLALCTGMRPGEGVVCQKKDIDFERGVVEICCKPEFEFKTKTRKRREVPILAELEDYLLSSDYFKRLRDTDFLVPLNSSVKIGKKREELLAEGFSRTLRRKTGVGDLVPYCFRHSYAVKMLVQTRDESRVAQYLGHSDTKMLHKYYAPFLPNHTKDELRNVRLMKPKLMVVQAAI